MEQALQETARSIAQYLGNVARNPVFKGEVSDLSSPLPEKGQVFSQLLQETFDKVAASSMHVSHPFYMAHMDSGVAFAGIVGDFVASALNQNLLSEELSPAATVLEKQVIRWFCNLAGLPATSGGTFVGGGTSANLTGLLAARDRAWPNASKQGLAGAPRMRVFVSAESHYSLKKSAAVLGLGSDAVIPIPVDARYRMSASALLQEIQKAKAAGELPVAIVATAGTTSTCSIDPIPEIAEIARRENIWLHVDASHGGALLFSASQRSKLTGIELANSIALDPHKWLWAPKSAGICLMRDFEAFTPASYFAPYLEREGKHRGLGGKTIDGSRHFDALKVWMILRHLGKERIGKMVDRNVDMTRFLYNTLSASSHWKPLHDPEMNVLCFQSTRANAPEKELYRRLLASKKAWISITSVQGKVALRTVVLNPSTDEKVLTELLQILEATS